MQQATLETAKNYEKEALERIRRMNIVAADLEVKGTKRGPGGVAGISEGWTDETRRQLHSLQEHDV